MASKAMIPFLVAMMLLTGVCNTLLTKYQVSPFTTGDNIEVETQPITRTCNVSAIATPKIPARSSVSPSLSSRREPCQFVFIAFV